MGSPHVFDATDQDFQTSVLEASSTQPVLVDFWAAWCGPCQTLGPILERLAEAFGGAFRLAKVDVDANPGLASAFQIQSIPLVVLVQDGRPVDAFQGALPESQIRAFLEKHLKPAAGEEEGSPLERAGARLEAGDVAAARTIAEEVLADAAADDDHAAARLLLARAALAEGDEAALRAQVEALPDDTPEQREAARLLDAFELAQGCTEDVATLEARLAEDEDDLEARYALGCCHVAAGRYEAALEAFLEVVRRDRSWRDEAGRRAMVAVFGMLGPGSDLARTWRRQLAILL